MDNTINVEELTGYDNNTKNHCPSEEEEDEDNYIGSSHLGLMRCRGRSLEDGLHY